MSGAFGMALLEKSDIGARLEEIMKDAWCSMSTDPEKKQPRLAPMAVAAMPQELEMTLPDFMNIGLVALKRDCYYLNAQPHVGVKVGAPRPACRGQDQDSHRSVR